MTEILYELHEKYIDPLLRFGGLFIGDDRVLRPANAGPDQVLTYNNKQIVVVRNDDEYAKFRAKQNDFEVFSPFLVQRHMILLANVIKRTLSQLVDPLTQKLTLVRYDEDLDDEFLENGTSVDDDVTLVGMFQKATSDGLIEVAFGYVDAAGNNLKTIVSHATNIPILSMYGVCVKAMSMYVAMMPIPMSNVDMAFVDILRKLNKYQIQWRKHKLHEDKLASMNLTDMSLETDMTDYNTAVPDFQNVKYIPFDQFVTKKSLRFTKQWDDPRNVLTLDSFMNFPKFILENVSHSSDSVVGMTSIIDETMFNDLVFL